MGMSDRVQVECPCCATRLVVDSASGEILAEERPKMNANKTFEDAISRVNTDRHH